MKPLRKHVGIAIDGGGVKGLIVARALMSLEKELGVRRLADYAPLTILAGTSTGAILTASLALGMEAGAVAQLYRDVGQQIFPRLVPAWFPRSFMRVTELLLTVFRRYLFSNVRLIEVLRETIRTQTGDADFTLAELNERIGPEKVLIVTTVDITERRTHFLKSSSENDGSWKLWEAILASSSVPAVFPIVSRRDGSGPAYYTDGGTGTYGNPAYIVAHEATAFRHYEPSEVSVLSFGSGWLNAEKFEQEYHRPTRWHGLDWARNAPKLFMADTIRSASLDILENPVTRAIDFRRFQFELEREIPGDAYGYDATYARMIRLGDELGERVARNQYASEQSPEYDPEGLFAHRARYRAARSSGGDD